MPKILDFLVGKAGFPNSTQSQVLFPEALEVADDEDEAADPSTSVSSFSDRLDFLGESSVASARYVPSNDHTTVTCRRALSLQRRLASPPRPARWKRPAPPVVSGTPAKKARHTPQKVMRSIKPAGRSAQGGRNSGGQPAISPQSSVIGGFASNSDQGQDELAGSDSPVVLEEGQELVRRAV
ncbi:hypothetical protein VDGL01_06185 [Verticillium dahliae]